MLAVNITSSLGGHLDERRGDVQTCAERWWVVSDSTLNGYADELLAVASNTVAGVFTVRSWHRDPETDNKVIFELTPATGWQWLVGQDSPITWSRGQANPVRKVAGFLVSELRSRQPHQITSSHGWSLDVAPDGTSAVVRAASPNLTLTALADGLARLTITQP
jgi:hypothetical protein